MKKYTLTIGLILNFLVVIAQQMPAMVNRVRLTDGDTSLVAELIPSMILKKPKSQLFYYWYSANQIHTTQGGFSGTLLNGKYEKYVNKNLVEQGYYLSGLKNGLWQTWQSNGWLKERLTYKKGLLDGPVTIFHAKDSVEVITYHKGAIRKKQARRPFLNHLPFLKHHD